MLSPAEVSHSLETPLTVHREILSLISFMFHVNSWRHQTLICMEIDDHWAFLAEADVLEGFLAEE